MARNLWDWKPLGKKIKRGLYKQLIIGALMQTVMGLQILLKK